MRVSLDPSRSHSFEVNRSESIARSLPVLSLEEGFGAIAYDVGKVYGAELVFFHGLYRLAMDF
jgi:hypothetical protein